MAEMADATDLKSVSCKESTGSIPVSGTSMNKYYYRYREMLWTDNRISIVLDIYHVLKLTAKGVWIEEYAGKKRFVLKGARKQFACPTKEDALISFRARKKRQIRILKHQLRRAELALKSEPDTMVYMDQLRS